MMPSGPPLATYRIQFNASFGFDQAAAIVPYLEGLGVTHLYASPLTKARAGSTHGYDVVDYQMLNPELGDAASFRGFVAALRRAHIGLILDFVPNHMGVHHADNAWWLDVLEWGPQSPYASYFDIDWEAPAAGNRPRVLLPVLGTSYGEALAQGAIKLRYDADAGSFSAWYFEHRLPIAPTQYSSIVRTAVIAAQAGKTATGRALLAASADFAGQSAPTRDTIDHFKRVLSQIDGAPIIERGLQAFAPRGRVAREGSRLHCLLERQHYRVAYWRLAATDINYRRFFDISSLAGVRSENSATFDDIHELIREMICRGDLQGLRIDHVDGLYDPAGYFQRLHELVRARRSDADGFYIVMEKILGPDEPVPKFVGVAGTTGYEWLNVISRLLADAGGLPELDRIWRDASDDQRGFAEILTQSKRYVLEHILAAEFAALARLLARIAAGHYGTRDYSAHRLCTALRSFVLHFPVYRTYATAAGPSPADREVIEHSIAAARAQWIGADDGIFDFLRDALTLDLIKRTPRHHSVPRVQRFAMKVQQFTGPLMAKSLEDTAFYRYHRLIAFNEVGGDPSAEALSVAEFHDRMRARNAASPNGLNATATHDTKRGEDARARLLCFSEVPAEWAEAVAGWRRANAHLVDDARPQRVPSLAHEYMLYQALLGAWPAAGPDATLPERITAFAVKAAREGKEQTSWLDPDEKYEVGLQRFIGGILDPGRSSAFLAAFERFAHRIALMGALKSLSQLALKCTMPGVPDFYQGTEFWDLSLVDPDNRRPVDFTARAASLEALTPAADWPALAHAWPDGRIKLALTARLLAIRKNFAAVFAMGDYRALVVEGRDRDEIVAFARCHGDKAIIVIVARMFGRNIQRGLHWPNSNWDASVAIPGLTPLRSLLDDRPVRCESSLQLADLFDVLPVAIVEACAVTVET